MSRLRISGIVGIANRVRQTLSLPLAPEQREALAAHVERALADIDALLTRHNASAAHLPAPSRRAYDFLKGLDVRNLPTAPAPAPAAPGHRRESIRFPGLRTYLTQVLDDVALSLVQGRFVPEAFLKLIRNTANRLNHLVDREQIAPEHLKPEPRALLGWFRYFSEEPAFMRYVAAVRRAQRLLPSPLSAQPRWRLPFLVHYRPSTLLYRLQVLPHGTRMIFDTPMLTFDENTLRQLAQRMLGRNRNQREMMAAMMGPDYKGMLADLQAAVGAVELTRGMVHDLAESFERVNREYFEGTMARPALAWSRTITGRKFGHYDFVHDRICISRTLDRPEVPAFVVDHVMHHELLHKKHGFRFRGQRQHAHTAEFRQEERKFRQYREADEFLKRLSEGSR
ncbi:MAG: hypothetical protein GXW89_01755 [Phycisphaerae bacterium]|nr:hypothetical protein [Phycisphaerae bacterium]